MNSRFPLRFQMWNELEAFTKVRNVEWIRGFHQLFIPLTTKLQVWLHFPLLLMPSKINDCSLSQTTWHILSDTLRKGKYKYHYLHSPLHILHSDFCFWLEQYVLLFVHLLREHDFHSINAKSEFCIP